MVPGVAENLKIISEKACKNIAHFAFRYAIENHRKKVTACHKAGIMFLIIFYYRKNIINSLGNWAMGYLKKPARK